MEYIEIGLECLGAMVSDELIINARTSIHQILQAIERAFLSQKDNVNSSVMTESAALRSVATSGRDPPYVQPNAQISSLFDQPLTSTTHNFICLGESRSQLQPRQRSQAYDASLPSATDYDLEAAMLDPISSLDFDVFTTDLFNFFPISTMNESLDSTQS